MYLTKDPILTTESGKLRCLAGTKQPYFHFGQKGEGQCRRARKEGSMFCAQHDKISEEMKKKEKVEKVVIGAYVGPKTHR